MTYRRIAKKMVLRPANLGSSYGGTNTGSFNPNTSRSILNDAIQNNVRIFDTDSDYGISERLLGERKF